MEQLFIDIEQEIIALDQSIKFSLGITHEMGNIQNTIMGLSEQTQHRINDLSPAEQATLFGRIQNEIKIQ